MGTPDAPDFSQEEKDRRLGQRAVERGWITPDQLAEAIADQARDRVAGRAKPRPIGNILASKGYLTSDRLVSLLDEIHSSPPDPEATVKVSSPVSFGKYSLLREVGRGGMGVVYEAIDTVLNRKVALKQILSEVDQDADQAREEVDRFMKEARLSATLSKHPHIVGVYDAGVVDGKCYLAMEFVEGLPMSKWRRAGPPPLRDQVGVLLDVARAVHHAHQHGIIHRDLKPDNILVGAQNQPHVTDFGLAKSLNPNVTAQLTAQGRVMGTPQYMSPEQAQGLPDLDARTDLYSLGIMLYEVLVGRPPFTGESPIALVMKAVNEPIPPPSKLLAAESRPAPDRRLEEICLKAVSKDPRRRHPTAEALAEDLDGWLRGASAPVPGPASAPAPAPAPAGTPLPARAVSPSPAPDETVIQASLPAPASVPAAGGRSRGWVAVATVGLLLGAGGAVLTWGFTPAQKNLWMARALAGIGRDREALGFYEKVLALEPTHAPALRERDALRERGAAKSSGPEGAPPPVKPPKVVSPAKAASDLLAKHQGPIDPAWTGAVALVPAEEQVSAVARKLKELNPQYNGVPKPRTEGGRVTELTVISSAISDLSPVQALPDLRAFELAPELEPGAPKIVRGRLEDLSPLRGLAGLRALRVTHTPVCDLRPLQDLRLTLLNLAGTGVADLLPLKGMNLTLSSLDLANTPVTDLSPLARMPLEFLVLADTGVTDISVLQGMPLKKLFLLRTKIADFSPIKDCPLVILRFPYLPQRDARWVHSLKTLEDINGEKAAKFLIDHPIPWQPLFDGKSTEPFSLEPRGGWVVRPNALQSSGQDCKLITKEAFDDGEFRIRFRADKVTYLSFAVRYSEEKGWGCSAVPEVDQVNGRLGPQEPVHEVVFLCHGDTISATLDGKTDLQLKNRNGPRKGPILIRVENGHLAVLSIDRR